MNYKITGALLLSLIFTTFNSQADSFFGGTLEGVGQTTESAGKTAANFFSLGAVKRAEKREEEENRRNRKNERRNRKQNKSNTKEQKYEEEQYGAYDEEND